MTAEAGPGGRRCAVLGSPIGHSLSPALHRAAYRELGLTTWVYDRFEVGESELADVVEQCDPSWRGLSVTMPLKVAVLELGEVDSVAELAGAGNTLIFDDDARRVYNTDVGGLVWAVRRVTRRPDAASHHPGHRGHGAVLAGLGRPAGSRAGHRAGSYAEPG